MLAYISFLMLNLLMRKNSLEKVLDAYKIGGESRSRIIGRAVSGVFAGLFFGGLGVGAVEALGDGNLISNLGTLVVGAAVGAVYEIQGKKREDALIDHLTSSTTIGS
jgi:hypothetical protein